MKTENQVNETTLAPAAGLSTELALYLGLVSDDKLRELLNISKRTSRRWRQIGTLPFVRLEAKVFYRIEDLKRILEDHFYRNKPLKNRR